MSPHINLHKAVKIYTVSKTSSEGEKREKCILRTSSLSRPLLSFFRNIISLNPQSQEGKLELPSSFHRWENRLFAVKWFTGYHTHLIQAPMHDLSPVPMNLFFYDVTHLLWYKITCIALVPYVVLKSFAGVWNDLKTRDASPPAALRHPHGLPMLTVGSIHSLVPLLRAQGGCQGKHTDWNRPPWPDTIVTICMSCFMTGDPGKEHRTNKAPPTGRVRERSKGDTTGPTTSQNPSRWHPSWLNKACTTRKNSESEWLAKDNLETNPITVKSKTVRHMAEQFSWVPLPSCSPPRCSFQ